VKVPYGAQNDAKYVQRVEPENLPKEHPGKNSFFPCKNQSIFKHLR